MYAQSFPGKTTNSINDYSFDLYKQTVQSDENLFISPISSYISLMAIYEGSKELTKAEFQKTLHLTNHNSFLKIDSLTKKITDKIGLSSLHISNAIWISNSFQLKPAYEKTIKDRYSAELSKMDFKNNTQSAKTINDWVANKTNEYIKKIISPDDINNQTALILTNAIFFKGEWKAKFDSTLTKPDCFYTLNKKSSKIDFMHQTKLFHYSETKN